MRAYYRIENTTPASQPSIYHIDTALQSEVMHGTRKCIPGSGDASECHGCLGIVTSTIKDGNIFNPGSSVVINCTHCGRGIAKTKTNQGTLNIVLNALKDIH